MRYARKTAAGDSSQRPADLDHALMESLEPRLMLSAASESIETIDADGEVSPSVSVPADEVAASTESQVNALSVSQSAMPAGVVVTIPDANLEQAFRDTLNKPTGDLTDTDLAGITYLDASTLGISNLEGLQYCTNATEIVLHSNSIADLSPLAGLVQLESLALWGNNISDLSPLANLTGLRALDLSGNAVSDLSPLANLSQLEMLDLSLGNVSDIQPLVDNTGLDYGDLLYLWANSLNQAALDTQIPSLQTRGVTVYYDGMPSLVAEGYVYDHATGAPLADVTIDVYQGHDLHWAGDDAWDHVDSVVTDAYGRYELHDLATRHYRLVVPGGSYNASAPYLESNHYNVQIVNGQVASLPDFQLHEAGILYGYVYDEYGQPLANAEVVVDAEFVEGMSQGWHSTWTDGAGRYELYLPATSEEVYPVYMRRAESDGTYYAQQIATGLYTASAEGAHGPDFHLQPGGVIHGRIVTDTGEPVADVDAVEIMTSIAGGELWYSEWTDYNGEFWLVGVPTGVQVHLASHDWGWRYVEVDGERYAWGNGWFGSYMLNPGDVVDAGTFVVQPAVAVSGYVLDDQGNPIAGAEVGAIGRDMDGRDISLDDDDGCYTDANGYYELDFIPAGRFQLTAFADGYLLDVPGAFFESVPGEAATYDFTMTPTSQGASVEGSIVDFGLVAPTNDAGNVLPYEFVDYDDYNRGEGVGVVAYDPTIPWTDWDLFYIDHRFTADEDVEDGWGDYFGASSAPAGTFLLNVPVGDQMVQAYRDGATPGGTWYANLSQPVLLSSLTAGQSVTGVALQFDLGTSSLTGDIIFPQGYLGNMSEDPAMIYLRRVDGSDGLGVALAGPEAGGTYYMGDLAAGDYYIYAVADGLAPFVSNTFTLGNDQHLIVDVTFQDSSVVTIADPALEQAIRDTLAKPDGDLTEADLAILTHLNAVEYGVVSLEGIQHCVNLQWLSIGANQISDLSPLAGLTNLTELYAESNLISGLTPLAGLTQLEYLSLSNNQISDLTPLTNLTQLVILDLTSNSVSDIQPLADNAGLDTDDIVILLSNSLNPAAYSTHIPAMEGRGVIAIYDAMPTGPEVNIVDSSGDPYDLSADFGLVALGGEVNADFFTVANTGDAVLELSFPWIFGGNSEFRTVISYNAGQVTEIDGTYYVAPGGHATFGAYFEPAVAGPVSGVLTLTTNDMTDGEDTVLLTFTGEGFDDTPTTGDLTGNVWEDVNGNGQWDAGEVGLAGATVFLDFNEDGIMDLDELMTISASDGSYTFLGLSEGPYQLGVIGNGQAGQGYWTVTAPAEGVATGVVVAGQAGQVTDFGLQWVDTTPVDLVPDANLEQAIRDELGKPTGDLTQADLESLTYLDAGSYGVVSLEGLQYCTNLTDLDASNNAISDLSPLAGLTGLTYLWIWDNNITDISPLAGLTNLLELDICNNSFTNLAPIAGMTQLTYLCAGYNGFSDISSLAGLEQLQELYIGNNNITDIQPLVNNAGLGADAEIELTGNPLNAAAYETHIPALEARGAYVWYDEISVDQPDLTAEVTSPLNVQVLPGGLVQIDYSVHNIGLADAGAFQARLFYSDDATVDESDPWDQGANWAGLATGQSIEDGMGFYAPVEPGTYYYAIKADGTELVGESDEWNNWSAVITVVVTDVIGEETYYIADYFPLEAGMVRSYRTTVVNPTGQASTSLVQSVAMPGVTPIGGADATQVQQYYDGRHERNTYYALGEGGLMLYRQEQSMARNANCTEFVGGLAMFPDQMQIGRTYVSSAPWSCEQAGWSGTYRQELTVVGLEQIVLPCGTFMALRVDFVVDADKTIGNSTVEVHDEYSAWLVEGVGVALENGTWSEGLHDAQARLWQFEYQMTSWGVANQGEPTPDLAVQFSNRVALPQQIVPGQTIRVPLEIQNLGTAQAAGTIAVELYAQNVADNSRTLLARQDSVRIRLAAGATGTVNLNFIASADLPIGEYRLVAVVDADNSLPEFNENNNETLAGATTEWIQHFGNAGDLGRRGVSLTLTDINGTPMTFRLTGDGYGEVVYDGDGNVDIFLYETTASTRVLISTPRGTQGVIDDIVVVREAVDEGWVGGSLGRLVARDCDLTGDVLCPDGWLGSLTLDDVADDHLILIGSGDRPVSLTFGSVAELSVVSSSPISRLTATEWLDADGTPDEILAPWIGMLRITGDRREGTLGHFGADMILSGEGAARNTLNRALIAGDLYEANWTITGSLGGLKVCGIAETSQVRTSGSMGPISLGAAVGSDFLAGVAADMRHASQHEDFLNPDACIASLRITGVDLGLGEVDPYFFEDSNFSAATIGRVSLLNLYGDNGGEAFGFFAAAGERQGLGPIVHRDTVSGQRWTWPAEGVDLLDFTAQEIGQAAKLAEVIR